MASPHLVRPYTAAQLGLVADAVPVVIFAVMGGRYAGASILAHLPTVIARLNWLDPAVATVVFIDEPIPDGATISRIDDMLTVFPDLDVDSLTGSIPATEALKLSHGDVVERGVDRSQVATVRCPEVVDRTVLTKALATIENRMWVNPTAEIARVGGRVAFYAPSMLPYWLRSG